jgi:hypothetical protein
MPTNATVVIVPSISDMREGGKNVSMEVEACLPRAMRVVIAVAVAVAVG